MAEAVAELILSKHTLCQHSVQLFSWVELLVGYSVEKLELSSGSYADYDVARLKTTTRQQLSLFTFASDTPITIQCNDTNVTILSEYGKEEIKVKAIEGFSATSQPIHFDITKMGEETDETVLRRKLRIICDRYR
uniref:Fatty acid-binding protein n=1 Tax=Syphacia muris TaxID=451379 RepID=A0A0N5AYE2_9BILA